MVEITIDKHIPNWGRYSGSGTWTTYVVKVTGLDLDDENVIGFKTTREYVMETLDKKWFHTDGSISIEKRRFESQSTHSTIEFVEVFRRRSGGGLKLLAKKTYSDEPERDWKWNRSI